MTHSTATRLEDILAQFRDDARNNRDLGDRFERLMQQFLGVDPLYAGLFSDVWLWNEWPLKGQVGDVGIDLVAREKATGDHWAIQCKFYLPEHTLSKADLDSFFTALGKPRFAKGMIVSTTDNWGKNAVDALHQTKPVIRLGIHDLEQSPIDWSRFDTRKPGRLKRTSKKKLRPHQQRALDDVIAGLAQADRGKLIMACGTGKTFTALKIAEALAPKLAGKGKVPHVLFLIPSLSLLSQTLREWTAEADLPLHSLAVCSDINIGKRRVKNNDDSPELTIHDLAFPATTSKKELLDQYHSLANLTKGSDGKPPLVVVFSTYQSLDAVSKAQSAGLPEFDLIICDEAHRTTGVTLSGEDESSFVKVHDAEFLKGTKRLYMTATPRIYGDDAKSKAKELSAELASMDDPAQFGHELHRLGFGEAVGQSLLSDYKVLVLAVDEKYVSKTFQKQIADKGTELNLADATKITGCWNGLEKRFEAVKTTVDFQGDVQPMRRAVAFSRSIKDSKKFVEQFGQIVGAYQEMHPDEQPLAIEADHVDGSFDALRRGALLDWLKAESPANTCRILSNARCLSEGVDVPALDAVLFLNPRNSVIDVVQSVGRVMRRAEGKRYGYIILPIGIPADKTPEEALKDNEKYKVVWQVLQALRAHDDRFNATINQLELNKNRPDNIQVIGVGGGPDADGQGGANSDGDSQPKVREVQSVFAFPNLDEWKDAIYAKMVMKVGERAYWETWARDIARIAETHITRIKALLDDPTSRQSQEFDTFLQGLQTNLNPAVSREDAIEMLAQHQITKPVFDALFANYVFTEKNPVSQSMQRMLDILHEHSLEKETATLEKFYASVRDRAKGLDNSEARQKVVIELYDEFFRAAFPRMAERLGIVYTPVEVVDFIIHSVQDILRDEFGSGLGEKDVHIIDPFTGTGTFLVRLLQSGLIPPDKLLHKYQHELHANEIVLLAYYIAAINIEETFHALSQSFNPNANGVGATEKTVLMGTQVDVSASGPKGRHSKAQGNALGLDPRTELSPEGAKQTLDESFALSGLSTGSLENPGRRGSAQADPLCPGLSGSGLSGQSPIDDGYIPFEGICLTDTFQLYESKQREFAGTFPENTARVKRQKASPIRVVIANPPYSVGQESENDNNKGIKYPQLDERIRTSYAAKSSATLVKNLYDSYVRALRWASDRIAGRGIVGFVTNGSFIDSNSMDGLRATLTGEFSTIYVFNLRGNARMSGEQRRMENGNVFGEGTRTPVAISLFIKNPAKSGPCELFYHDIGDYLSREEKLAILKRFKNINGIRRAEQWQCIQPNDAHDWINQRDPAFESFVALGNKKDEHSETIFANYSQGLLTSRDKWCYGFSKTAVATNMSRMIDFYNDQVAYFAKLGEGLTKAERAELVEKTIDTDPKKISWSGNLKDDLAKCVTHEFADHSIATAIYRPFVRQTVYFNSDFNERLYQLPRIFPKPGIENRAICTTAVGNRVEFSTVMCDSIPDLHMADSNGAGQCFPLYLYEKADESGKLDLGKHDGEIIDGYRRRDAITDAILKTFREAYGNDDRRVGPAAHRRAGPPSLDANRAGGPALEASLSHPTAKAEITKEDIFYYVYGVLHSPEYRTRFAADLKKMLPRIPLTQAITDFQAFSTAGRELAKWHLNYETVEPWPLAEHMDRFDFDSWEQFQVQKMTFARPTPEQKAAGMKWDKTKILYNSHVTISQIPLEAYDYVVNGKPAIEWVMERYQVTRDKDSGIVNDPNDWCREHNQPRYILDLIPRVIRVSMETIKIVKSLPALNEQTGGTP